MLVSGVPVPVRIRSATAEDHEAVARPCQQGQARRAAHLALVRPAWADRLTATGFGKRPAAPAISVLVAGSGA